MKGRIYRLIEFLQMVQQRLDLEERRQQLDALTLLHLRSPRVRTDNAITHARPMDQSPPEAACRKSPLRLTKSYECVAEQSAFTRIKKSITQQRVARVNATSSALLAQLLA